MIQVFELIAQNLGMGLEHIILIIAFLAGFIMYAADVRIGLLIQFIVSSLCSIWFYSSGYNYSYALILTLITLVLMSLSLLFTNKTATPGGVA